MNTPTKRSPGPSRDRGGLQQPRKQIPRGEIADIAAEFGSFFEKNKLDISHLLATHWRIPHLKLYIMWFYYQLAPESCLGITEPVPYQWEKADRLVEIFEKMSDLKVDKIPDHLNFINTIDSFFNEVELTLVSAEVNGFNWLRDQISLLIVPSEKYVGDGGPQEYILQPGMPLKMKIRWQSCPATVNISIKTPEYLCFVLTKKVTRICDVDGTFLLRFSGSRGMRYQKKEHQSRLAKIINILPGETMVEYETQGTRIDVNEVHLTVRATWSGPRDDFKASHTKIMDLKYGSAPLKFKTDAKSGLAAAPADDSVIIQIDQQMEF